MREAGQNLTDAKKYVLAAGQGQLKVVVHKGRNRYETFEGKVGAMYPNVFTIEEEGAGVKTFSYSDVLTRHVRLISLKD